MKNTEFKAPMELNDQALDMIAGSGFFDRFTTVFECVADTSKKLLKPILDTAESVSTQIVDDTLDALELREFILSASQKLGES